jgi:hypothetical protein
VKWWSVGRQWHESIMYHFFHNVNQCKKIFKKKLSFVFDGATVNVLKIFMKKFLQVFFHQPQGSQ